MDILYQDLLNRLTAQVPELQWVDYDQGQIDFPETNYPITFPAVLIDFENTEWEDIGQMIQGGDVTISLRVVFRLYEDLNSHTPAASRQEGLNKLQLLNTIHKALQGFSGVLYNSMNRIRQFTEKRNDGLKVVVMQYGTYLMDRHAMPGYVEQKVDNLEVTQ